MTTGDRVLAPDDLICANFTLGGLAGTFTLEQRAGAAAAAGFRFIGWMPSGYAAERAAGHSDSDIRAMLAHFDVAVAEIEFLHGWTAAGDPGFDWHQQERDLFALADLVGARHLNCGDIGFTGPMLPLDAVAERFAGICDRAADHGLLMAIEFLPWTEIPDAGAAWEIARRAGQANGGVLVDSWHYFRGRADPAQLRAIPPERIVVIQLDDAGPPEGAAWDDTSHRRRLPGEGEFDLAGLLSLLGDMGVAAPISVEILSDELSALPATDAARLAYDAASVVLSNARG